MIRNLDQLELSIKALSLHEKDIVVIRTENMPTIAEMQNIQQGIANLMSTLDLGFSVSYVVLPRSLSLEQLDEDGMRNAGWIRAWQPIRSSELMHSIQTRISRADEL